MFPRVSLTTRITAFSLGAHALVLGGFSATIFFVARSSLSAQADERLGAALSTLLAAVEINAEGYEWEPDQRRLALGLEHEADAVRWTVHDDQRFLVDRSLNLASPLLLSQLPLPDHQGERTYHRIRLDGRAWRVVQKRLGPDRSGKGEEEVPIHRSLTLTTAICLEPLDATVRHLGRLLAGVSVGVWLLAAALARKFCQRALAPLTRMAEAARGMGAAEPDFRLPDPATGDELHELADAFNGLLDRLHEAFARQTRFTGDASHQLRTPLAVMLGQIDVSLRRDRPPDDYRRTLSLVRDQADRLNRIVETLLFLARADSEARLTTDRETLDLSSWTRDHLTAWSSHPRAADLTMIPADRPVPVQVHSPLLGQLLDNLLDNAFKYSEPESPVVVRVSLLGDDALLSVLDRGPGIPAEDLPHVFEPFFRSPRARHLGPDSRTSVLPSRWSNTTH